MMKNNKFCGAWFTFFVSMGVFLSGCGQQEGGSQTAQGAKNTNAPVAAAGSSAETTKKDFVVVGVDVQSAPMAFWDAKSNVIVGYDIDLAKEGLKRAGLKYEFKPIQWNKKEKNLLEEKNIDLIWSSMTVTEERKRIFAFSSPYIQNKQTIMVRADSGIQRKADLGGRKVAVNKGSVGADLVKRLSGPEAPAKVEEFEERVDIFSAVLSGQADAAVTDGLVTNYYVANSPGKFQVLKDSLQEEDFAVAVRPSDTELLEKINKALAEMLADGTAQVIYQRWFGGGANQ